MMALRRPFDPPDDETFSVFVSHAPPDRQSWTECVRRGVVADSAVKAAEHYTRCVAAQLGWIEWVRITDNLDFCVFEWRREIGVTFPRG